MKILVLISLILVIMWVIYKPVLFTYFAQDDFFHFVLAQKHSGLSALWDWNNFEERGVAFYRPLSREILYGIYYQIFELRSEPFRIFAMMVQSINVILVIRLFMLWINRRASLFAGLFFALTASNVAVLYYLAGGIQAEIAVMMSLISLLAFESFYKTNNTLSLFVGMFSSVFALISHEMASVLVVMIFWRWYIGYRDKLTLRVVWKYFTLLGMLVVLLVWIDFFQIGYDRNGLQYLVVFSIKRFINTYMWYLVWAIGIPEMLIDFVRSGIRLDPNLMKYWGNYYQIIFPAFITLVIGLIGLSVSLIRKHDRGIISWQFLGLIIWFIIAIFPVALLPEHKSTYYLALANVGLAGIFGILCDRGLFFQKLQWLVYIVVISFVVLSVESAFFGSKFYWAATRGRLAGKIINEIYGKYPKVPANTIFYIENDPSYPYVAKEWGGTSKQVMLAINNRDALRLLYHRNDLQVYYQDGLHPPENVCWSNMIKIIAKI